MASANDELGGVGDAGAAAMEAFVEASRDRDAFEAMAKMKAFETVAAPIAIRILERIAEVNGLELDEEKLGAGECAASDLDEKTWPAPDVVRLAQEIAEQGGTRPDTALMLSMHSSTHGLEARMARVREVREQRLLPESRDLETLQRYEAGLERSLFRTMHELERLQAHRSGGEVPVPAVLDVDVTLQPPST